MLELIPIDELNELCKKHNIDLDLKQKDKISVLRQITKNGKCDLNFKVLPQSKSKTENESSFIGFCVLMLFIIGIPIILSSIKH